MNPFDQLAAEIAEHAEEIRVLELRITALERIDAEISEAA